MTPTQIKAFMTKHNLNQEHFATLIGVSPMCVSNWVRGNRSMSLTTARVLRLFERKPQLMKEFVL